MQTSQKIPSWQASPASNVSLTKYDKKDPAREVLQQEFLSSKECFGFHVAFYTDGSKTVSCVMVPEESVKSHGLNKVMSIFMAPTSTIMITLVNVEADSLSSFLTACGTQAQKPHCM